VRAVAWSTSEALHPDLTFGLCGQEIPTQYLTVPGNKKVSHRGRWTPVSPVAGSLPVRRREFPDRTTKRRCLETAPIDLTGTAARAAWPRLINQVDAEPALAGRAILRGPMRSGDFENTADQPWAPPLPSVAGWRLALRRYGRKRLGSCLES
jgi:hypothetical protein